MLNMRSYRFGATFWGKLSLKCTETRRVHSLKPFEKWLRNWPVFKQKPLRKPQSHKQHAVDLTDGKRPLHTIEQIKEFIRQGWRIFLGWDTFVHHWDHNCCGEEAEQSVRKATPVLNHSVGYACAPAQAATESRCEPAQSASHSLECRCGPCHCSHCRWQERWQCGPLTWCLFSWLLFLCAFMWLVKRKVSMRSKSCRPLSPVTGTKARPLKSSSESFKRAGPVHIPQCIRVLL